MKIAIIGARSMDSSYGGIEKVLSELCPRLTVLGHEIHVFCENKEGGQRSRDGVFLRYVPALPGKYTETISRSFMATIVTSLGSYDLINFVGIGSGALSFLPRIIQKKPVIVSCHGLDWRRDKWPAPARMALQAAEKILVRSADEITVVSQELKHYFQAQHGRDVALIPNGLNVQRENDNYESLERLDLEAGGYLLFASRLVPEKAPHELIEAFNNVITDKKLVIAGGSRYDLDYVRSLKNIDRTGRCVFTGHVTGALLDALFRGAYLYVLPSHMEGLSLSLLEAMGYGKCAVVSDISENLEVVGEAGFSFPVGNIEALGSLLQNLVNSSSEVSAMAMRARDRAETHFSWNSIAEQYAEVYERVGLKNKNNRAGGEVVQGRLKSENDKLGYHRRSL
jgi:glycosyltransferase involved in cell wall biosynthesis